MNSLVCSINYTLCANKKGHVKECYLTQVWQSDLVVVVYLNLYLDIYRLNFGLNFLIDVLEGIFIVRNVRSIFSVK